MPKSNTQIPYSENDLFAAGKQRTYTGNALKEVAFPLGGIGTGTVSLGGRGQLRDWEIFNRPGKGKVPSNTFPTIFTRSSSGETMARVLESRFLPPFDGDGMGLPYRQVYGLPRLKDAIFHGEYPFARIEFVDDKLPLKVELTAFNPMIPLNEKDSAIPAAVLRYTVKNEGTERVDTTIAWSVMNSCGSDGTFQLTRHNSAYGDQTNEFVDDGTFRGIRMTQSKYPEDDIRYGSMALVTTHKDVTYLEAWNRTGAWFDATQAFWDDFKADGELTDNGMHGPNKEEMADVCTLGLKVSLAPGESAELPFVLSWYFPNRQNYWNSEEQVKEAKLRNYYGNLWKGAWDVAGYVIENLARLESETATFRDTLYSSTLPAIVLDAAGANMSIMRTTTCLWLGDDRFYAFEGCCDNSGCCPLNCTHVWNYEQAVAYLYPRFERTMRETDFKNNLWEQGKMAFRTLVPLGDAKWDFHGAADGQMGCLLKYYREYLISGDMDFLKSLYPGAKQTMEFAWIEWDKDQDGVMEGIQHNTYDIEFHGPNAMMGSLYLGALKAMEKIATMMGDTQFAAKCAGIYESGYEKHSEMLFNGEFYTQPYDYENGPIYQFGDGCVSDQILGQWFCEVLGLGKILPPDEIHATLQSIFRYNWKPSLADHESVQRTYALNDEAGLLLCSWPKGGRPKLPFVYADEVWTGIEYQVAANLIYEGMLDEGLSIVKGVRDRHDGIARNPWDEFECGHHYARAMSSWSLILALSGFHCNMAENCVEFAPKVNSSDFRSFYSTGSGWGVYSQKLANSKLIASIGVTWGEQVIKTIKLEVPSDCACTAVSASLAGTAIASAFEQTDGKITVTLAQPAKIAAGAALEITIA